MVFTCVIVRAGASDGEGPVHKVPGPCLFVFTDWSVGYQKKLRITSATSPV